MKIFPNLKRKNIWTILRSSTSFYVLIPLDILITSTSLNAQLMIALFIFVLGERKKFKALVIQYCTMMTKATSIITREKTQKKKLSLLRSKVFPKGVTASLSHHQHKRHYPQCESCKGIEKIKINKSKKTIESDLVVNKKVKNQYSDSFLLQYIVWD